MFKNKEFPAGGLDPLHRDRNKRSAEDIRKHRAIVHEVRNAEAFDRDSRDVRWPAQAVDRLIREARNKGLKRADIRNALANRHYDVQHWERLRMKEGTREIPADLVKKPRPYVQLLEALADVLGMAPDDAIYDAFQNTTFARHSRALANDPIDELLWLLDEMCRAIIRSENLSDYFQRARTVRASYVPVSGDFVQGKHPLMAVGYHNAPGEHGGYVGEADVSWDAPPLPGASLLRAQRVQFSGPLRIERDRIADEGCNIAEVARSLALPDEPTFAVPLFGPCDIVEAEITIFQDLRLVLGPRKKADDLGPMFELRSFVALKTDDTDRPLTFPYSVLPISMHADQDAFVNEFVGTVAASFADGWHRITGFGYGDWKGTVEIDENFGHFLDADFSFDGIVGQGGFEFVIGWLPVNFDTVSQLVQASPHGHRLFESFGPYLRPTEIWLQAFPDLQISLYAGALERALIDDCRRLSTNLNTRIAEAREVHEREMASALARWQQMGTTLP